MPEVLRDGYGRPVRYLRVSLTDRCQLRCRYCIPRSPGRIRRYDVLSYEEILAFLSILVEDFGVEKVRFTGGEPLLRRGVLDFLARVRDRFPRLPIGLTTNGLTLIRDACRLRDLGIRVNVSLDTLDPERYRRLTGVDALDRVLRGMRVARDQGLRFKINTVLLRGWNESDLLDLITLARTLGVPIRFIEYMPVSASSRDFRKLFLSEAEARMRIGQVYTLVPDPGASSESVARMYRTREDPELRIGFISTVSRPFCHGCTRLRITATGHVVLCLFDGKGYDLKPLLRPRVDREGVRRFFRALVRQRPPGFAAQRQEILQRSPTTRSTFSMRDLGG